MTKTNYIKTSAALFTLVALFHLWLAVSGNNISLGETQLGLWVNWTAVVVIGYMAIVGCRMKK